MPFGQRNSVQLKHFIGLLSGHPWTRLLLWIHQKHSYEEHVRQLFQCLDAYGLIINPDKCEFGKSELIFLGHLISKEGTQSLQEKVQVVLFSLSETSKKLKCAYKSLTTDLYFQMQFR